MTEQRKTHKTRHHFYISRLRLSVCGLGFRDAEESCVDSWRGVPVARRCRNCLRTKPKERAHAD